MLLMAFPRAHGVILGALYLPVALMLVGLILRGVAFDFRVKARAAHKPLWDRAFGPARCSPRWRQGYMLGLVDRRLRDAAGPRWPSRCSSAPRSPPAMRCSAPAG